MLLGLGRNRKGLRTQYDDHKNWTERKEMSESRKERMVLLGNYFRSLSW